MKKFGATLIGIILAAHLTACTSKESREDDMTPPSEETAAVDSELEKVDGAPTDEANAGFVDDQLPEQALGEAPADDTAVADAGAAPADGDLDLSTPADSAPADGMATADAGAVPADGLPAEPTPELDLSAPAPETPVAEAPIETPAPTETLTAEAPVETPVEEKKTEVAAAPKVSAPIQKVKDTPYRQGDQLLNAYYIVRPGDNYKKMARTIFGDASRQSDLKKANPDIKTPKVGNKIYYTSTTRPSDETSMKSFYEDQGQSAEVYVVKEGDTLKSIAGNVLGTREGSIELCSLNRDLDCKGDLVAGTEIRYFKGGISAGMDSSSSTTVAKSDELAAPPAPPAMEDSSLPPMDAPPAPDMAMNPPPPEPPTSEFPPPPDMNQGAAAGSMAMNEPPPPPPPPEMAPPPPPPPVEMAPPPPPAPPIAKAPKAGPVDGFTNDDMMMGLGAVGILAAGIAAIMVIRKRRQQKEMASAFGDTQVGA